MCVFCDPCKNWTYDLGVASTTLLPTVLDSIWGILFNEIRFSVIPSMPFLWRLCMPHVQTKDTNLASSGFSRLLSKGEYFHLWLSQFPVYKSMHLPNQCLGPHLREHVSSQIHHTDVVCWRPGSSHSRFLIKAEQTCKRCRLLAWTGFP